MECAKTPQLIGMSHTRVHGDGTSSDFAPPVRQDSPEYASYLICPPSTDNKKNIAGKATATHSEADTKTDSMERRSMSSTVGGKKAPRRIACVRCRTRKKRCDHVLPTCGECRRTNAECVQYGVKKAGSVATVPIAYLQQLEDQLAEMQGTAAQISVAGPRDGLPELVEDGSTTLQDQSVYSSSFDHSSEAPQAQSMPGSDTVPGDASYLGASGPQYQVQSFNPSFGGNTNSNTQPPSTARREQRYSVPAGLSQSRSQFFPGLQQSTPSWLGQSTVAAQNAMLSIGEDWLDHYADIYFEHVQPQWSFLDENAWRLTYSVLKSDPSGPEGAQKFILQLVLAIGALMSSSFRPDCPHLSHATRLHDGAICANLNQATQHPSSLIRTQASMLMLLYSFHGPSPDSIPGSIMLTLMNCANLMSPESRDPVADSLGETYEYVRRHAIMSAHILNEVVASAWTYPQPFMFEFLDDTVISTAVFGTRITLAN